MLQRQWSSGEAYPSEFPYHRLAPNPNPNPNPNPDPDPDY